MNMKVTKKTGVKRKKTAQKKNKPVNADVTRCVNPATGEVFAEYVLDSVEDVKRAVSRGRMAQPAWAALPIKKRIEHIIKIRDYIVENIDELADVISRDNGKTRTDALLTELVSATMAVSYYCSHAKKFLKDRKLGTGNILFINKRSRIARIPFGVVGIISPWNYPFAIPFSEIIMALLAGNAIIYKAASETQAVGQALRRCIDAAELPTGVFNYLNLPGSVAGDAFLEAGIDKLFFTGSVPIGKYLMKKASETLTPVSLELGGNDPAIVCADADLHRAATGIVWGGFQNAGQSCGGVERVYVDRKVYSRFMEMLKKETEALRIGNGASLDVEIGAMATERQMRTVREHIDDALAKGAKVFAQSKPAPGLKGNFLPCVVLTDVNHDMLVMKDETFGPVIGVMPFDTIDEVVELANDSNLGLTASIWSKSRGKAIKLARRIKAGALTINDHLMSHGMAETPWGGFKESGIGRTHGDIGFDEMTQPQLIMNDVLPLVKKNFWWHPFSKTIYDGGKGAAYLLYGKGIGQHLKGAVLLFKAFPRTFFANKRK